MLDSALTRSLLASAALACVLPLAACPTKLPKRERAKAQASVGEEDPRVVRDTDDLYPADKPPRPVDDGPAPGSGKPDTSNGVCRLFAPKLPEPTCCSFETGFDAEQIRELCGHDLYLGESLQNSCGYYFMPEMEGSSPVAIRVSRLIKTDVAEAAKAHDERIRFTFKLPEFSSSPVEGVEGVLASSHDGVHWAFVPGWEQVRLVSWIDEACPDAAVPKMLAIIAGAKEPPKGAERPGLVPVARE